MQANIIPCPCFIKEGVAQIQLQVSRPLMLLKQVFKNLPCCLLSLSAAWLLLCIIKHVIDVGCKGVYGVIPGGEILMLQHAESLCIFVNLFCPLVFSISFICNKTNPIGSSSTLRQQFIKNTSLGPQSNLI